VAVDSDLRNHPDILWYPRFDTEQTVYEDWGYTTRSKSYSAPGGRDPTFGVPVPEFGITAVRHGSSWTGNVLCGTYEIDPATGYRKICSTGDGSSVMNWRFFLNQNTKSQSAAKALGDKPLNDLYLRQCYMVEADVQLGMTESGMKLGGFAPAASSVNSLGIGTVLWHEKKAADGRFRLTTYWFGSGLTGSSGYGGDWIREPYTAPFYMAVNKWYCGETFLRVNTRNADGTVNSDGTLIQWFYDMETGEQREVYRGENLKLHNKSTGVIEINNIHGQLFHGGSATPSRQIHWRVTGFALSHRRIGPPKVLH
jgi:hypothetical protein